MKTKKYMISIASIMTFAISALGSGDLSAPKWDFLANENQMYIGFLKNYIDNRDVKNSDKVILNSMFFGKDKGILLEPANDITGKIREDHKKEPEMTPNEEKAWLAKEMDKMREYAKEKYPQFQGKTAQEIVDWYRSTHPETKKQPGTP